MLDRLGGSLRRILAPLDGEDGQTLTEYRLLILLLAVALVGATTLFGFALRDMWNRGIAQLPF